MKITSKGQVTIPLEIREKLGLRPHTDVEFEIVGKVAQIRKTRRGSGRGRAAVAALRGTATSGLTTDQIMALMRGSRDDVDRGPD